MTSSRRSDSKRYQPPGLREEAVAFDSPNRVSKDRSDLRVSGPKLGPFEFLRWGWRVLTSMRTAIVLLIMLAVAAIPGSLVPQRSSDPNGVSAILSNDPDLYRFYDSLQLFTVFTSVWFSAIYLLLFISLIGCLIPRTTHHLGAVLAKPTSPPSSWNRLPVRFELVGKGSVTERLDAAEKALRSARFRVIRSKSGISAESGYLRETGNLVFHISLMGILATIAFAGGFGWNGQRILVEGQAFTNQLASYESFHPGAWFNETQLEPYGLTLESFTAEYSRDETKQSWVATDYTAEVGVSSGGQTGTQILKVNDPLSVGGSEIYLLGNGFAPVIIVRDEIGNEVFNQPVVFLSQDANLTSVGVVKVPDGLRQQFGMQGFFYPSAVALDSGALSSDNPEPTNPILTLNLYTGDLGLDSGQSSNVFQLPIDKMTQIAGRHTDTKVELRPGELFRIPGNLGTIEFAGLKRYVGLEMRHDPTQFGVGISVLFLVAGLITSFAIRRRRVWVRVSPNNPSALEWGAQTRDDDPSLERRVKDIAQNSILGKRVRL